MAEERITEVETPSGNTHTHTTVVSDGERSGGGATWIIVLLLIVVAAGALYFFSGMAGSEANKDNAIANAANAGKSGGAAARGEDIGAMAEPPAEAALEA